MKNHRFGFSTAIDVIELSDAFRRRALKTDDYAAVAALVKYGRRFVVLSTWYDEYLPEVEKARFADELAAITKKMEGVAARLGADAVILPVSGDIRSPFSKFFNETVRPRLKQDAKVNYTLQMTTYDKDLSSFGKIDRRIKTALDKGVRGMADIDDRIKMSWDIKGPTRGLTW